MPRQLDADTLRLMWYETSALYHMGLYLKPPPQPATLPSPQETPPRTSSRASFCASTPSPESFSGYTPFRTATPPTPTNPVVQQALLEAFLIHYRILAEFLCKQKKSWDDQILAAEFADVPKYANIDAKRDLCDKWLSHLSSHRDPQNKPTWDYSNMYKDIIEALRDFLEPLAKDLDPKAIEFYYGVVALPLSLH